MDNAHESRFNIGDQITVITRRGESGRLVCSGLVGGRVMVCSAAEYSESSSAEMEAGIVGVGFEPSSVRLSPSRE